MERDDELAALWRCERPPPLGAIAGRVVRQQRLRQCKRGVEFGLILFALWLFANALLAERMRAEQWLLLPFFAALLPVLLILKLRRRRPRLRDLEQTVVAYARLRLAQLSEHLCDLRIERQAALALLVYAAMAWLGSWLLDDVAVLRQPALGLLLCALPWYLGTAWFVRWRRVGLLREYRAMRRLVKLVAGAR